MIEHARTRDLYDELKVGDMVVRMLELTGDFNAVICNFAIYHIADLTPFFAAAADLLVSGGALLISTDPCSDTHDIRQTGSNEYAHSRAYLRRLAEGAGLEVEAITIMAHRAYPGFWCVFRKP